MLNECSIDENFHIQSALCGGRYTEGWMLSTFSEALDYDE